MVKIEPFDTARHLDNPEVISHYLNEAFETRDRKLIVRAITNVVRASRIADIARATGLSRTSLYWKNKASPEFTTVLKVLDAVGVRLDPIPAKDETPWLTIDPTGLTPRQRKAWHAYQEATKRAREQREELEEILKGKSRPSRSGRKRRQSSPPTSRTSAHAGSRRH